MEMVRRNDRTVALNKVLAALLSLALVLGLASLRVHAEEYAKQGGDLKVHMVDPSAEYISVHHLTNGDYLNTISIGYDNNSPVSFTIDIGDGDGTNHLNVEEFNDYVKVFTSETLSEDSLIYTLGTDESLTMSDIGEQTSLNRGRKYKVSISGLSKGTTYYLAFMEGMTSSQRGTSMGENSIIFQFNTLEDANRVDSISLNKKALVFDGLGQSVKLIAKVLPEAAVDKSVKWSSSASSVASVDAEGTVKGLAKGTAVITATTVDGEKTATCNVTVNDSDNDRILSSVSGTQTLASEARFVIDEPSVFQDDSSGRYVIVNEVERDDLPDIVITMIPNGGRKSTMFNPHVYADAALTEEVATLGNGITAVIPDYTTGTFTIDPSEIEEGETYFFALDKRSSCGGVLLGEDVVIEFSVKVVSNLPDENSLSWNGYNGHSTTSTEYNISMQWVKPTPLETAGLQKNAAGEQFYFDRCKTMIDGTKDLDLEFTMQGNGSQHVETSAWNHIFLYSDDSLSEESLVASIANGKIQNAAVTIAGSPVLTATVPAGTLQAGKTYYLVTDEDLETNRGRVMAVKTVTKLTTGTEEHTHVEDTVPGKPATCTETGLTDGKKCSACGEWIIKQEEIPAKGHTEELVKGKAATCTEKGLTDGKKCSVCGEWIVKQEEIPALEHKKADPIKENEVAATCVKEGSYDEVVFCAECHTEISREKKTVNKLSHTEVIVKGTPSTCTETGLTAGKNCSVCGEFLEAQKEIAALGHDFKDGKCTRCGAADPGYKPKEPDEPVVLNGIVKGSDGKWAMYKDNKVVTSYTGIAKNQYGWWRIENGYVNFNAQGIYKNEYGWWKTTDGKVTFDETGIFQNEYGWWRVEDSKVNFKANEIYKNQYGWWKTTNGKVTFQENGVFKNEYGWWKVEKSKVNFKFTGIAKNDYGTWYVKNGKVDFSKNGTVQYKGTTYQATSGKVKQIS